jgi:hypothetical protein
MMSRIGCGRSEIRRSSVRGEIVLRRIAIPSLMLAACSGTFAERSLSTEPGSPRGGELVFAALPPGVHLEVDYPHAGDVIADYACGAFFAGRAKVIEARMDVAIVIDTSRSTIDPSGADVDRDGVTGVGAPEKVQSIFDAGSDDREDSILAAEISAARRLVSGFEPRTTRIALIAFAGDPRSAYSDRPPRDAPARTLEPLTSDISKIQGALEALLHESPRGATHMAAGLNQAIAELGASELGTAGARVIYFFTDGQPTLPFAPEREGDNVREVLKAIGRASNAGIRIDSFAIGADALDGPLAVVEMARLTDGEFVPVRDPAQLTVAVEHTEAPGLRSVRVFNRRTDAEAPLLRVQDDGSWGAFVTLEDGPNEIEVTARSSDGSETVRTIGVRYEHQAQPRVVSEELQALHRALLTDCLDRERRKRLELELELKRRLRLEIEEERRKATKRAKDQRKRLELSIEEE